MTMLAPMRRKRRGSAVPEALDLPRLTLNDIADGIGKTRAALEKYRTGSPMPLADRLQLAAYLDGHAVRLQQLAEALRAEAADAEG